MFLLESSVTYAIPVGSQSVMRGSNTDKEELCPEVANISVMSSC